MHHIHVFYIDILIYCMHVIITEKPLEGVINKVLYCMRLGRLELSYSTNRTLLIASSKLPLIYGKQHIHFITVECDGDTDMCFFLFFLG